MATALLLVSSCTVSACAFNDAGCHAGAITVGGSDGHATCSTFITLDARGGIPSGTRQVGACQRLDAPITVT